MKAAFKYFIIWLLITTAATVMVYLIGSIILTLTGHPINNISDLGDNVWITAIALLLADLIILLVFWKRRYTRFGTDFGFTFGEAFSSKNLYLWCIVGAIGCLLFDLMAECYLPIPENPELIETLMQMMTNPIGLISVCLIGPLTEEVIFRGAIERRLLERYKNPWIAIVVSALFFAVAHFNFAQAFTAIIIGIFMGWIYYRTRSIWPTVVIHVVNNTAASLFALVAPETMQAEDYAPSLDVGIIMFLISIMLIYLTVKFIAHMTKDRTPVPVPVNEVLPPPLPVEAVTGTPMPDEPVLGSPLPDETDNPQPPQI